jgi:predicted RNA-binding Zn ribbon-like protein
MICSVDTSRLHLLVSFLNSRELNGVPDCLASPDLYLRWATEWAPDALDESGVDAAALLAAAQPFATPPSEATLRALRAARDALLALLDGDPEAAAAALHGQTSGLRLEARLRGAGISLEPAAGGADGLPAHAFALAYEAMADGVWDRLSRCRNDECRWVFIDRSRNRSRRWCDMSACGSVVKARAYRRRKRTASREETPADGA